MGLFLWVLMAAIPGEIEFTGEVVDVSEGDLLKVEYKGEAIRIRLFGVDCPEKGQPFGDEADQMTQKLSMGKRVFVQGKGYDRFGRLMAFVRLPDGSSLNQELLKSGLAWWFRKFAWNEQGLESMEFGARETKVGLWSKPDPVPPWDWRDGKRKMDPLEVLGNPDLYRPILANQKNGFYYWEGCPSYTRIFPVERVYYESREEAEKAGYRPATECH